MSEVEGRKQVLSVGVNGFGRIGRLFTRAALLRKKFKIVAINDPFMTADYMAYLLNHDSVHGHFEMTVSAAESGDSLEVGGQVIKVFTCKDASQIPWADLGVEYVAETSGAYTTREKATAHLSAGAKRVVISAPLGDETVPMFVMGVNHLSYNPSAPDSQVVSNASCTTNCLAPLAKILNDSFIVVEGLMTTIHSVTATQLVVDGPSQRDWRAGRSAGLNIIPSSTGAAKAVGKVVPALQGKLTGMAFRVPTANVSVVDLTCRLEKPINDLGDIAGAIQRAVDESSQQGGGKGLDLRSIIGVTMEEVVSSDFLGDSRSCVVDLKASIMLNPTFIKVVAYYDNEWAYSMRMVDLMTHMYCMEEGGDGAKEKEEKA